MMLSFLGTCFLPHSQGNCSPASAAQSGGGGAVCL
jgi:hypothetical protein